LVSKLKAAATTADMVSDKTLINPDIEATQNTIKSVANKNKGILNQK